MIRPADRRLANLLVRFGIWHVEIQMWCPRLRPSKRTRWLWRWMRARQAGEELPYHHAPACPANRWAEQELVLGRCTCGAVRHRVLSRKERP
jgi:hypothetical protein